MKSDGQLDAFITYIRENPARSWLRKSHREYFQRVNEIDFLGRKWYGYGNAALLDLPVLEPFRCSRKWVEGGPEWCEAIARASRLGPGGAGISTFMSPCEKACGHALGLAGGRWIVLSPEGFASILWKDAGRAKEASEVMNITAQDLKRLKVIDKIVPEYGGADKDTKQAIGVYLKEGIKHFLKKYDGMEPEMIAEERYKRFRAY